MKGVKKELSHLKYRRQTNITEVRRKVSGGEWTPVLNVPRSQEKCEQKLTFRFSKMEILGDLNKSSE